MGIIGARDLLSEGMDAMGEKVMVARFDLSDRGRYREKLRRCLVALRRLLEEQRFDQPRNLIGMEIELNLLDGSGLPLMVNHEVLQRIASRDFQTELGMFNLEVNIAPHRLSGRVFDQLAEELQIGLGYADRKARELSAGIVMVGILPTLREADLVPEILSRDERYSVLNDQFIAARGEVFVLDIEGVERLECSSGSLATEAACTSMQLHLQVTPGRFASVWNAAQSVAAAQVAVGANAPFLFGRELWQETRVPLFEQAVDTRPVELAAQGVRPRAWFGERWVDSPLDLFEENVRYFPALLPVCAEEDPLRVLDAGGVPRLGELQLLNGTIYRWNRPVYAVAGGVPHLRVENRVLPAGPTVVDVVANAAFYFGLVRSLADAPRPVWGRLPFEVARENLVRACRFGLDAVLRWPRGGRGHLVEVAAGRLVEEELLPLAAAGLDAWGVEAVDRDRYLGVIAGRCRGGVNGAVWQSRVFHHCREGLGLGRAAALAEMTRRYCELAAAGEPVHTWPVR